MEWEKLNLTVSKERASKKRLSGEAYDINKQKIYIAPKLKKNQGSIMPRSPHGAKIPQNNSTKYPMNHCR